MSSVKAFTLYNATRAKVGRSYQTSKKKGHTHKSQVANISLAIFFFPTIVLMMLSQVSSDKKRLGRGI